ncbi:ATP-dependent DNA/RNA helicase DHX36 [Diachasma alloeum]|uniref:ATP-dependent DNA/RNA helicase DHX36 n=1 Tax=Diachasma alloeum TaxID=454923 RepID=UPI0007383EA2|nr:ATP-dependent DNA/RNA helicase DHX36 [Diachasma alloeum]
MSRFSWTDQRGGGHSRYGQSGDPAPGNSHDRRHNGVGHPRGGGRGRGRGGHPPGLKGKEIGLYYRDKARKNDAKEHYFSLAPMVEETVETLLTRLKTPYAQESDSPDEATDYFNDKYNHIKDSQFKRKFLDIVSGSIQQNLSRALLMTSKLIKNDKIDKQLIDEQSDRESLDDYQRMLDFRSKLPSYKMREEILDLIHGNQVLVISGETGCGKTTQVAQFILDDEIERGRGSTTKIVCTQPRRISAISVAERVAAERAEPLGRSVGYQIRLEKVMSRDYGSMLFCTTGLLLQYMQGDPALRDFSHIILDEIHERNTESDFIITLLKQVIPKRPDLKVILMSATLNSETFARYYDNCPNIHIPGFTYPVREFYLEDILEVTRFRFPPAQKLPDNYKKHMKKFKEMKEKASDFEGFVEPAVRQMEAEGSYPPYVTNELRNPNSEVLSLELIQELLVWISSAKGPGAILVFLPGMMDISKLNKSLLESGKFPSHRFHIYPLHSRLPTVDQRLIFRPPVPGVRKIIIATSIAETSITIEDVVFVVDCGRTKLTRFDIAKNLETLEPEWISMANAKQRRGRAGRVQPGEVYRLYTRAREMTFDQYPTPEMLRTPLEQVILQAKILQLGRVEVFLGSVIDPPEDRAIHLSLELLRTLNALDANEHLTPLGYHLAKLPLDPRTGKMVLWASMFSCVEPVFGIAASLAFKDAFYCPLGKEEEANRAKLDLGMGHYSDHIALAEAVRQYERALRSRNAGRFCSENFLSWNTLKLLVDMKGQFARHLYDMKFLESEDPSDERSNRNSHNFAMIKAIVCAGLYPNIATVKNHGNFPKLKTSEDGTVKIHPSSVNARAKHLPSPYVTYFLKQKSTAIYLHDTTCVNEAALIFAAPKSSIRAQGQRSLIVLNDSISFLCKQTTAGIIQRLREEMDKLLEHKITHPGSIKEQSQEDTVIRAIIELVSESDASVDLDVGRYRRTNY